MKVAAQCGLLAAIFLSLAAQAQNITHTIIVTTGQDGNFPEQCTLRQAFDNVNAGKKVGNNACGPAADTLDDETTEIVLPADHVKPESVIFHTDNHALVSGGVINGMGKVRLLELSGKATKLYLKGVRLQRGRGEGLTGGAVTVLEKSRLEAVDTTFWWNRADSGGAINVQGGDVRFDGVVFAENSARHFGGGMVVCGGDESYGNAEAVNSLFELNDSDDQGGGAVGACIRSFFTAVNTRFLDNWSSSRGGAVLAYGRLALDKAHFVGNTSAEAGGAVDVAEFSEQSVILNSRFERNVASGSSGRGGAVHVTDPVVIRGSSFDQNWATAAGGAIFVEPRNPTMFSLENSTLANNGSDVGGALAVTARGTVALDDTLPLGADYGVRILGNSFVENHGKSQIHFPDESDSDAKDMLMVNNLIDGNDESVAACSGHVIAVQGRRNNDFSGQNRNVSWPEECAKGFFIVQSNSLGALAQGGYFDQFYAKPHGGPWTGDHVSCAEAEGIDQWSLARFYCLMGAVENAPPTVNLPEIPKW